MSRKGESAAGDKRHSAPVFENLAILEASAREPETRAAIPSEQDVLRAKRWVDENEL